METMYRPFLDKTALSDLPHIRVNHDSTCDSIIGEFETQGLASIVSCEPFTTETKRKYECVLHQPETKKKQRLFVEHLHCPERTMVFDLKENQALSQMVMILERPTEGNSRSIRINVPTGRNFQLFVVEWSKILEPKFTKYNRPTIFIEGQVSRDAKLDIVYLHPFYQGDIEHLHLKRKQAPIYLYRGAVKKGGTFFWTSVNFGDSAIEKGLVDLVESHASANLAGASFMPSQSKQIVQSRIRCFHPYSFAKIKNHGVVENDGDGTFISVTDIVKGAKQTFVREDNRFMTLGDRATVFTDPTLLIDEYDIKASHAATVGQLDENTLFYLQSRGLTKDQAKRLITIGFLAPLFDRISVPSLKEKLLDLLSEKVYGA